MVQETTNDLAMPCTSMDGTTLVVGAPTTYDDFGEVSIFKLNSYNNEFAKVRLDIVDKGINAGFGAAMSMSVDALTLFVGAPNAKVNFSNMGKVSIYKFIKNASACTQLEFDINDTENNDAFGVSVSTSADGSTLVVCVHLRQM
jgi:hypothetical protein